MRNIDEIKNELREFFEEEFRKQDESHMRTVRLHREIMSDIERVTRTPSLY